MPQKEGPAMGMEYDETESKPKPEHKMLNSEEALEMSCGAMMQSLRSDDVKAFCRAFKAAYKACEQYEEEMENSHGSHGGY